MLILAIDSSTKVGSASLITSEKIVGEKLLNLKETHSQRLMPQIIDLFKSCNYEVQDLDGIGVALGPGSFTGTRIGVTTAKTLAQTLDISIVGVSTLKAMAYGLKYVSGYICPMIDAKRNRVFTCLYQGENELSSESDETLIHIDDLLSELEDVQEEIYFIGEITTTHKEKIIKKLKQPKFTTNGFNLPRGGFVGELALNKLLTGEEDSLFELTPNYLKRSQAEIQWARKHS